MGRAFEFRKARKFKRWDKMSKAFTKIGREIAIAVRLGGPDPEGNSRLRMAITNAKGVNMPKDRIEGAIKRASSKDQEAFQEVVYEGYGPSGVPIIVECATDNPTRTVANVRSAFTRSGGQLATTGSLDFMFERKGVFKFPKDGLDLDELELELIDFGVEDLSVEEGEVTLITSFADFVQMQRALEERKVPVSSAELQRLPTVFKELPEEAEEAVFELIDKLEEDDDVQSVYHNLK
ncbi:MAG: YebC/PmpR family DNA-binding transcriptional regulator [Bacteroidota bacterium]|nr:YebC/PmpR family DNA-binding transcriptional regulator [Bacteroidota bacterium]MDP4234648.1 YebC/PmpR family DNA-binding transcriptional regulator [Bacteroidota bacterium]MDP4243813.1 YebC/PmpR family DNA-binding transcriptional regulator [Bacteroidota bacterium]MDP4288596.1 YebC/PmpR family DNA-binding transcriptional regulator [Bacteroidota bacterium]